MCRFVVVETTVDNQKLKKKTHQLKSRCGWANRDAIALVALRNCTGRPGNRGPTASADGDADDRQRDDRGPCGTLDDHYFFNK